MNTPSSAKTNGFILGKFMPLHKGHQHLIDFALSRTSELTVMTGSLKSEPIPGELRVQWIKELYPQIRVVHCTDENPQMPEQHPDFWEIWISSIRKHCPVRIHNVFSSEQYGFELARRLGAEHIPCDVDRIRVPVSGTIIRSDPFLQWDYLPGPVRAYYAKRVVITGPESTGKTTLAKRLADHYQTAWVPEFGWEYVDRLDRPLIAEDFLNIARGQIESEDRLSRESNRVLICDTDLMVTRFFSEVYTGGCDEGILEMENRRRYNLHLVLDTDVPYESHPQRNHPHLRDYFRERFISEMRQKQMRFRIISGDREERFRQAVDAVDALFQRTE